MFTLQGLRILVEALFYLFILALAGIVFLFAIRPGVSDLIQQVLLTIGGAFIGIPLGGVAYRLLYFDPLSHLANQIQGLTSLVKQNVSSYPVLENVTEMGVVKLLSDRSDFKLDDLLELMKKANELDLLGVSHVEIIHDLEFKDALLSYLTNGKKCRIILLDPTSEEIKRRELYEGELTNLERRAEMSIEIIKEVCTSLAKSKVKNSEMDENDQEIRQQAEVHLGEIIRLYAYAPSCMMIRADGFMIVSNYVFGKGGHSPALKLQHKGELFKIFSAHFEETWQASSKETQYARPLCRSDFERLFKDDLNQSQNSVIKDEINRRESQQSVNPLREEILTLIRKITHQLFGKTN